MKKLLEIGEIVKPQGIKGEVKLVPYMDKLNAYKSLKRVIIDGQTKEIVGARHDGSGVFLLFQGVSDRNTAETYRKKIVSIPIEEAEPFRKGYFIVELEGLNVFVGEKPVGVLEQVLKTGAVDVFSVKGDRPFMTPFLKKLVVRVDLDEGKIVFDPKVFEEVVCYED